MLPRVKIVLVLVLLLVLVHETCAQVPVNTKFNPKSGLLTLVAEPPGPNIYTTPSAKWSPVPWAALAFSQLPLIHRGCTELDASSNFLAALYLPSRIGKSWEVDARATWELDPGLLKGQPFERPPDFSNGMASFSFVVATAQGDDSKKVGEPLTPAQLDLSLEPPTLNTHPGPEYADDARPGNMIIGLERTPKGRLWACWVGNGDSPNGFFMLATSDDGGAHWSPPRLVIDPTDPPGLPQRRALVGNLWTDPSGRLWLFFDQSLGYFDGRAGDWATICENPDAEEPTWTAPVRIADGCTLNKPIVAANGDWLLPVSLWPRHNIGPEILKEAHHELDPIRMANVYASSDQGKTWVRRGGVAFPGTNFDEHMLIEKRDGRLWMLARTGKGPFESYSTDQGKTWSEPQSSAIQNPSARFFIRRLQSGNLLLVKNGPIAERLPRRSNLCAYLSADDGQTWSAPLLLDDRAEVSYPDGLQAPDGTIHILYDWNRHSDAEILLAKFHEEDIAAGKLTSPGGKLRQLVNKALAPHPNPAIRPDAKWAAQAAEDAKEDRQVFAYDGVTPNKLVCDTTLRILPDGTWALFMLAGGDSEPSPKNYTGLTRSTDQGKTWSPLEPFNVGFPREGDTIGQGPTELFTIGQRSTLFFATHANHWKTGWRSWVLTSDDSFKTWSAPAELPGRLKDRTFIRPSIVARDGRLIAPFQHYIGPVAEQDKPPLERAFTNPRNGVLISKDNGATWTEHGDIRLTPNDRYFGWAEPSIVELSGNRIAMVIRADALGGLLYTAESKDGGLTWPDFASVSKIPNPGSKATILSLGGDTVALLHNPNSKHRSPLALWISFDGMKTWPYQRVLVPESTDGPTGRLNYPDGFVSADKQRLHFAYDDNRHRAVVYSAKLPKLDDELVEVVGEVPHEDREAQTKRAFEQVREADLVAYYDIEKTVRLEKPESKEVFLNEAQFLDYATKRDQPKNSLVVILGKSAYSYTTEGWIEGLFDACKRTGFKRVSIQGAGAMGRGILRETPAGPVK